VFEVGAFLELALRWQPNAEGLGHGAQLVINARLFARGRLGQVVKFEVGGSRGSESAELGGAEVALKSVERKVGIIALPNERIVIFRHLGGRDLMTGLLCEESRSEGNGQKESESAHGFKKGFVRKDRGAVSSSGSLPRIS